MKRLLVKVFFVVIAFFLFIKPVAASDKVDIYFFSSIGCPHCAQEKVFLNELEVEYPNILLHEFEISKDKNNLELFKQVGEFLQADTSGVPFTVIGSKYFIGFLDQQTSGVQIEQAVISVSDGQDFDILEDLILGKENLVKKDSESNGIIIPESFKLPLIGELSTKSFSLPILTLVIALLDGFNPCAMWVLIFLISMLLSLEDKKRRWILGITFIIASTFVYFLFMTAWLNLFLFLGFIFWVRLVIGLIALGAAYYNLREFITNKNASCKVVKPGARQNIIDKIKKISQRKELYIALIGIILLAFAVNLIEAVCSAGLPAIYTHILSLNKLTTVEYYLYILFYLFIFMIDDLLIFTIAMVTLQLSGIDTKYTRYSHLIGGIVMLIIGALLLFKPELLMFG